MQTPYIAAAARESRNTAALIGEPAGSGDGLLLAPSIVIATTALLASSGLLHRPFELRIYSS
jgi:hypothetical protein